jgi:hypothetical protein
LSSDDPPVSARPRSSGWAIAVVVGLSALFGCHQCGPEEDVGHLGVLVGGPCLEHDDCVERCLEGGRYPNGTCTVDCEDDSNCPEGTWCVDHEGGVCLLGCDDDDECRGGYECESRERRGSPGDVLTCRSD